MIKAITALLVLIFSVSCGIKTTESNQLVSSKAVFGEDNREDVYLSSNPEHIEWARSTAAMVDHKTIEQWHKTGRLPTLRERGITIFKEGLIFPITGKVCPDMKFADQPAAANCSGFLVAPDLLVTAGHCMNKEEMCKTFSWVFDYQVDSENGVAITRENTYGCAEIVEQSLVKSEEIFDQEEVQAYKNCMEATFGSSSGSYGSYGFNPCGDAPKPVAMDYTNEVDYALIRLDRLVVNRAPLQFRTSGKIGVDTELVLIGNPLALPTKIATDARVLLNDVPHSFSANLDSFKGNSGSAVFNAETGVVEGVLVRGAQPFIYDKARKCYEIESWDQEGLVWKDENKNRKDILAGINRITSILSLMNL